MVLGHNWDIRCCDWHPGKSLIASGSRDSLVKLWDPRSGTPLNTLHGHKNGVLSVKWNPNGNWLVTTAKDQVIAAESVVELLMFV